MKGNMGMKEGKHTSNHQQVTCFDRRGWGEAARCPPLQTDADLHRFTMAAKQVGPSGLNRMVPVGGSCGKGRCCDGVMATEEKAHQ